MMKKRSLLVVFTVAVAAAFPILAQKDQEGLRGRLSIEDSAPERSGPLGGYANIVDEVSPAVVSIVTTVGARAQQTTTLPDLFNDPMFRRFFGDPFGDPNSPQGRQREPMPAPKRQGQGSGVVLTSDGYIATNNHVIENAEKITLRMLVQHRSGIPNYTNSPNFWMDPKLKLSGLIRRPIWR